MAELSHVNMFFWPGPPTPSLVAVKQWIPLGEDADLEALEAIMSNRRFRKLLEELGAMDKAAASELVKRELSAILPEYIRLYDDQSRRLLPSARETRRQSKPFIPVFAIDNVPQHKTVIAGARLKTLGLVWISGMLGLVESRGEVERVARLAVEQRTALYEVATVDNFFKAEMLRMASLYNRRIISSSLLGVAMERDLVVSAMQAAGVQWEERKLASYSAALTEYDLPVRSGVMKPDYSRGSLTVKFTSRMDDQHFDILLKKLHSTP